MPSQDYRSPDISSRAITGMFFQELELAAGQSWLPEIANEFDSTQDTETYTGLGNVPQLREWLGPKNVHKFNQASVAITNRDFEGTIEVSLKDLRRDKTGQLRARIGELASRSVSHDAKLLSTLIENGNNTNEASCFDGKALWANDHSFGSSGTIDNNIDYDISAAPVTTTGSTTAPSGAGMAHAILNAVSTLQTFKDDHAEPVNEFVTRIVIMTPIGGLQTAADLAVAQATQDDGETNILRSGRNIQYLVFGNPRLTWTDKFAVFNASGRMKALILQRETGAMFKALAEGSDYEFDNNAHKYSVEKSGYVGLGRFDQTVLTTLT